ncbi:hypothetical protein H6F98_18865 [Microcoleus sp. FACHB-SPT15]|uniref:hypothetical protein n=1 Tax=Microcoleus sp. FACHB-SPT15 TaxID=2692830 RepID=UPI00177AD791|nr:hypothetical protein [Microcoleus sp. FACHB-SPT15]MBD1807490.1 hypothetical protein [Microcoleus sp. FACHB-SPT15]
MVEFLHRSSFNLTVVRMLGIVVTDYLWKWRSPNLWKSMLKSGETPLFSIFW